MKLIYKMRYAFLATVLFVASCGKFVDGYEVSPNSPSEATPGLLLSITEVATFSHYSGQLARQSSIMTQHMAGTDFQFLDIAKYIIQEGDNVNEWESIYQIGMMNAKTLINTAGDANPAYRGIGKVLMAMNLGLATDLWGDIPYSQALRGLEGEYDAANDTQESIIASIQTLLTEAIADLGNPTNALTPGSDDYVYGGDTDKWIAAAHVLKARYANRLSQRNAATSATDALAAIDDAMAAGFIGTASDCNAKFGTAGNELNQWHAFQLNRAGYMKMGKHFVDLLVAINDPRLPFYASTDDAGGYTGTASNSADVSTSNIGTYFASASANVPMITYVEAKFIEAEAALRAGQPARAALAHNAAIKAHVEQVTGATIPAAYEAAQASETDLTITLEKIMTHKYVAMFTQIESYADWRRTGFPTLTPNPDGNVANIPLRLPTPQSERLYNASITPVSNILSPVWWDN